jgi:hypothetical protein
MRSGRLIQALGEELEGLNSSEGAGEGIAKLFSTEVRLSVINLLQHTLGVLALVPTSGAAL